MYTVTSCLLFIECKDPVWSQFLSRAVKFTVRCFTQACQSSEVNIHLDKYSLFSFYLLQLVHLYRLLPGISNEKISKEYVFRPVAELEPFTFTSCQRIPLLLSWADPEGEQGVQTYLENHRKIPPPLRSNWIPPWSNCFSKGGIGPTLLLKGGCSSFSTTCYLPILLE